MAAMLRQAITSRLAGGGGQPGGSLSGANPEAIGQAVSGQYSELQGADPGKMTADLNRIKQELAAMFPNAVLRVGDMGKGISQAITGINSAIKAAQKAKETLQTVHPPLGNAVANPQATSEGGGQTPQMPGAAGMGGF
jgi:hypothetical protein